MVNSDPVPNNWCVQLDTKFILSVNILLRAKRVMFLTCQHLGLPRVHGSDRNSGLRGKAVRLM